MKMSFVYFHCCRVTGKISNFWAYYLHMKSDVTSLMSVNIMFSAYKSILFLLSIGTSIGGMMLLHFLTLGL